MSTTKAPMTPLLFRRQPPEEMQSAADAFCATMRARRSVRQFSDEAVPLDVVRRCIEAAAQSPSGANMQPWTFCLVSDPATKRAIREAAEREEREFYERRAPQPWLDALQPLGTDAHKPFLETAPALIVMFVHLRTPDGRKTYYPQESAGIAAGVLLAALQHAGLATLTHTPSPMRFLAEILRRPEHERAYLLIPVGYPADGCEVPAIERRPLADVLVEV